MPLNVITRGETLCVNNGKGKIFQHMEAWPQMTRIPQDEFLHTYCTTRGYTEYITHTLQSSF